MQIQRVGFSSAEAATIAIPAHQAGDLIIMFAFRDGNVTNPTIPAGWQTLTNTADGTLTSVSAGWKIAQSNGETSGTWTNTTGLVVAVYRNTATNKTPVGTPQFGTGTTNTLSYTGLDPMKAPGTSWVVAFIGHRSIDVTVETPPAGLSNRTDTVGALAEHAGHDSNGPAASWPTTTVAATGTASGWQTMTIEVFAEQGYPNNYKAVDAPATNAGVISVGERIF